MGKEAVLMTQATRAGRAWRRMRLLRMGRNDVKNVATSAKRVAMMSLRELQAERSPKPAIPAGLQSSVHLMTCQQFHCRSCAFQRGWVPLFRYRVSRVVEYLLDLCQCHLLGIVGEMDRLGGNVHIDTPHACQCSKSPFYRVLTMLTR